MDARAFVSVVSKKEDRSKKIERILLENRSKIFGICFRILRNKSAADDACQEALIRIWRFLDCFRENAAFETWLHKIAVNEALTYLRKERSKFRSGSPRLVDVSNWEELVNPCLGPDRKFYQENSSQYFGERIQEILDELPSEYRYVLFARYRDGMTVKETAEALSLSESAVKTYTFRAVRELRESLQEKKVGMADFSLILS